MVIGTIIAAGIFTVDADHHRAVASTTARLKLVIARIPVISCGASTCVSAAVGSSACAVLTTRTTIASGCMIARIATPAALALALMVGASGNTRAVLTAETAVAPCRVLTTQPTPSVCTVARVRAAGAIRTSYCRLAQGDDVGILFHTVYQLPAAGVPKWQEHGSATGITEIEAPPEVSQRANSRLGDTTEGEKREERRRPSE